MPAKKVDYQIIIEAGSFGAGFDYHRVLVIEDRPGKPRVKSFNEAVIYAGFGSGPQEAINDFIRRNSSDVLDMIFDL